MQFARVPTLGHGAAALALVALTGCAALPSSGPTAHQVVQAATKANLLGFHIVNIDTAESVDAAAATIQPSQSLAALERQGMVDLVGPGDVLAVSIFEVGTRLFGSGGSSAASADQGVSASDTGLAGVVVDRDGAITLPYIGRIVVAGLTPAQVQERIQRGLRGMSQSPQALVAVRKNVSNTVVVLGVVARPGRQELSLARDRLLDAIAEAGGTGLQPQEDMVVRVTRGGRSVEQLLSAIRSGGADDLVLLPNDRIQVVRRPQSYTVFGATRVSQINFESPALTLAEAVARVGGPADDRADATAIFIFRYPRNTDGTPRPSQGPSDRPVIYRLDMMNPTSYFFAQQFAMRDKDVLFVANAASNRPAKLIAIINQLFSPIITARAISR